MKKSKKRSALVIALVVLLLATAVGYALFSRTLTISGTATAKGTWDVHFENASLDIEDGEKNTISITNGTKTADTLTVKVALTEPGQTAEATVDVVNKSTVRANLSGFTITAKDGSQQSISASGGTYTSGVIQMNLNASDPVFDNDQTLAPETGEKEYKMTFTWIDNGEEIVDDSASFTIELVYEQAQ